MADELVDVISEDGKILRTVGKYEVNAKGHLHICVIRESEIEALKREVE